MASAESNIDYWSLTSSQLASQIDRIAHASPTEFDYATLIETRLLAEEWQQALTMPKETFEQQETRRGLIGALQRRSIEILIHTSRTR